MKSIIRRTPRIAIIGLVGAVLLGGAAAASTIAPLLVRGPEVRSVFGLEAPLPLDELMRRADVVVVTTVGAETIERFTANTAVPAADRDTLYQRGLYRDQTLNVLEYVKGAGPRQISLRSHAPSSDLAITVEGLPEFRQGVTYVMFLERGRGVWVGGFRPIAVRGIGAIVGSDAEFAAFGRVPLAQLRDIANRTR